MRMEEVPRLLQIASVYQANIRDAGSVEDVARAWFMALDTRMTLAQGLDITAHLASRGTRLHPSTINEQFLLLNRQPHEQGVGKPVLPMDEGRQVRANRQPLALGAPDPVRSDEVPEYVAARAAARESKSSALRAWSAPCPYCHVPAGEPCVTGSGSRLKHRLAHPSREMAVAGV